MPVVELPLPTLPPRPADSHKGDFGRALLIGGSRGMTGAIALAGMATLRSGAGLVTLAVPDVCQDVVAGYEPSYMTVGLPSDPDGRLGPADAVRSRLEQHFARCTAVAVGPGLGRSPAVDVFVTQLYTTLPAPLVVDADALNALADHPDALDRPAGPRILTPHPGEFFRLCPGTYSSRETYESAAEQLAARTAAIVVLKGHRTLVTDGQHSTRNDTGNPGMATGGVGDVLTGVITALLCQGLMPFDAARLGVHVHGAAGDRAALRLGQVSLTARDVVRSLPPAFTAFSREAQGGRPS